MESLVKPLDEYCEFLAAASEEQRSKISQQRGTWSASDQSDWQRYFKIELAKVKQKLLTGKMNPTHASQLSAKWHQRLMNQLLDPDQ